LLDFDLIVIGAGSGGVRAARTASSFGLRVCIIEEKYFGGTCVNVGCVPKKLFYYSSSFKKEFLNSKNYGWNSSELSFDWNKLCENKNIEVSRLNKIYENLLTNSNVKIIKGRASFVDSNTVNVDGSNYSSKHILIASGCVPTKPDFLGGEHTFSSVDLFYLNKLPSSILIIGGGYIAVEFASIFNSLGVETTISYRGSRIIKHFDECLGERLADSFIKNGIDVLFNSNVEKINKIENDCYSVVFSDGSIKTFDKVISAIGRSPLTENLSLSNTSVVLDQSGYIVVDNNFKTTDKNIFAIGDVIGTPELTPVALKQAMVFVNNNFNNKKDFIDYTLIPTAIFAQPNVASIGWNEKEAKKEFTNIDVYESEFTHLKESFNTNKDKIYMKLVIDSKSDKVLGAHMIGTDAAEIIQGIAIAIISGATKKDFDETLGIHPTAAEEFVTMRIKKK